MTQHREGEGKSCETRQKLAMESLTEQGVSKEHSRCRIQNELLTGKKKGRCKNSQEATAVVLGQGNDYYLELDMEGSRNGDVDNTQGYLKGRIKIVGRIEYRR